MMGWMQKDKKRPHARTHTPAEAAPERGERRRERAVNGEDGGDLCRRRLDALLHSQNIQSRGVVMKLHLENFKQLNEILGYAYCQNLLSQIISYLEGVSGSPVYRYIGVEFLIILRNASVSQASQLAEDILAQFDRVWKVDGTDCLCSVQIGLCPYPGYADSADDMMKLLDMALTRASAMGPNQYTVYDSQMQADFVRRQTIAKHLQNAIDREEIEVRYRPVYNIETRRFSRGEFDMRVFIPGIGMVSSTEFLPIAEDSGQIRSVEYFALDRVSACIRRLCDIGVDFDSIALPISSVLFLQEDFIDRVAALIRDYGIPSGKLALELEEDIFTMGNLSANTTLQTLSAMGVELILNHFGSGISSVTGVLDLSVNTLKLDRMLLWQLETNPKAATVIAGLVRMVRELGLNIMAEGVETSGQLKILNATGCTFQQGFYYSPAVSEESMTRILASDRARAQQIIEQEKLQLKR